MWQCKWRRLVAKIGTNASEKEKVEENIARGTTDPGYCKLRRLFELWSQYPGPIVSLAMFTVSVKQFNCLYKTIKRLATCLKIS